MSTIKTAKMFPLCLYAMQHIYDDNCQVRACFVRDSSKVANLDDWELGQDLSHFAHRDRRRFMQIMHLSQLHEADEVQIHGRLAESAYFKYLCSLGLKISSITQKNVEKRDQDCVCYHYCVMLQEA